MDEEYERNLMAHYEALRECGNFRGDPHEEAMLYILARLKNIHMFDTPMTADIHIRRIKGKLK